VVCYGFGVSSQVSEHEQPHGIIRSVASSWARAACSESALCGISREHLAALNGRAVPVGGCINRTANQLLQAGISTAGQKSGSNGSDTLPALAAVKAGLGPEAAAPGPHKC
jgi:hypothetical protein